MKTVLISACLIGMNTRYNGECKPVETCRDAVQQHNPHCRFIPVCPEQLGGFPTPREAADLMGGDGAAVLDGSAKILTKSGVDVTRQFCAGAEEVLKLARLTGAEEAWLKARSPSCAVSGTRGVTAALLQRNGIRLVEY